MNEWFVPANWPTKPKVWSLGLTSRRLQGAHRLKGWLLIEINTCKDRHRVAKLDTKQNPVYESGAQFIRTVGPSLPEYKYPGTGTDTTRVCSIFELLVGCPPFWPVSPGFLSATPAVSLPHCLPHPLAGNRGPCTRIAQSLREFGVELIHCSVPSRSCRERSSL